MHKSQLFFFSLISLVTFNCSSMDIVAQGMVKAGNTLDGLFTVANQTLFGNNKKPTTSAEDFRKNLRLFNEKADSLKNTIQLTDYMTQLTNNGTRIKMMEDLGKLKQGIQFLVNISQRENNNSIKKSLRITHIEKIEKILDPSSTPNLIEQDIEDLKTDVNILADFSIDKDHQSTILDSFNLFSTRIDQNHLNEETQAIFAAKEKLEQERLHKAQMAEQRLQQQIEQQKEKERIEQERIAKVKAERAIKEKEAKELQIKQQEEQKLEKEMAQSIAFIHNQLQQITSEINNKEKLEKAEKEAKEKQLELQKKEEEKQALERAEKYKLMQQEKERLENERLEQEKLEKENQEKIEREQKEKLEQERLAKAKQEEEKLEQELKKIEEDTQKAKSTLFRKRIYGGVTFCAIAALIYYLNFYTNFTSFFSHS